MFDNTADNQTGYKINLQLFAEDGSPAPAPEATPVVPDTTEPAAASSDPRETQSLTDYFNSRMAGNSENQVDPNTIAPEPPASTIPGQQAAEPGGSPTPDTIPPVNEPQDVDIPDKFKNPDGSVNLAALAKSYVNLESMYGKSQNAQQLETLNQTNQQLQQLVMTMQAERQQATAPRQPEISQEEQQAQLEAENEKFWEDYNQNPKQAIASLIDSALKETVQPMLTPIQKEMQFRQELQNWNSQMDTLAQTHEDFDEMLPAIREIVAEYGQLLEKEPNAIEIAYNMAKKMQPGPQYAPAEPQPAQPPTVDELLGNQEFISQLAQNPTVKNLILQQHMQEIKNNPAPPVIGSQPGGLPPSSPPVDLKDMKTAKEALKAKYSGMTFS